LDEMPSHLAHSNSDVVFHRSMSSGPRSYLRVGTDDERGLSCQTCRDVVLWYRGVDSEWKTSTDLDAGDVEDQTVSAYRPQQPCHAGDGLRGEDRAMDTHR
jgi:hypothetical protein